MKNIAVCFIGVASVVIAIFVFRPEVFSSLQVQAAQQQLARCNQRDEATRQQCAKGAIRRAVSLYGIDTALGAVGAVFSNQNSGQLCHDLTHLIGQEAYRMYARDEHVPITPKTTYCSYGFFHGVSEALAAASGDVRDVRAFCEYVIRESQLVGPDPEYQCYHGLGHGTVNPHDPALWGDPIAMASPAIALCREVAQTSHQLESCGTGIFAGIASFFSQNEYGLTVDKNDPFWVCMNVPLDFREPCFRDMSSVAMVAAGGDWRKAVTYIEDIPEDSYALGAMRTFGIDLSMVDISICRSVQTRIRSACIEDFVRQTWQDSRPGEEFASMFVLCSSSGLDDNEGEVCWRYSFGYLRMFKSAQQRVVCDQVKDQKYKTMCSEYISNEI